MFKGVLILSPCREFQVKPESCTLMHSPLATNAYLVEYRFATVFLVRVRTGSVVVVDGMVGVLG